MSIKIESTTLERLVVTVTTTDDPTGSPPDFAVTPITDTDPSAWVAGTWFGGWDSTNGTIEAVSPQVGRAPAGLELTEGSNVRLWIRWTAGADQPVRDVGWLQVE